MFFWGKSISFYAFVCFFSGQSVEALAHAVPCCSAEALQRLTVLSTPHGLAVEKPGLPLLFSRKNMVGAYLLHAGICSKSQRSQGHTK